MNKTEIHLDDLERTKFYASKLAKLTNIGDVITFTGKLGAGKTSFIQYFIRSLAEDELEVTSPTFNLLHVYKLDKLEIDHFDLYRLKNIEEAYELGIEHAFENAITLIEWPQIIMNILPKDRLEINLSFGEKENSRLMTLQAFGKWDNIITQDFIDSGE